MHDLSDEQKKIIEYSGSRVVIAHPGSGKTFTLACIVRKILQQLPQYKGVIAISFTNKASDELKKRSLQGYELDKKGSFFGTIDKFLISEVLFPFGTHVFGNPLTQLRIEKIDANSTFKEFKDLKLLDLNGARLQRVSELYTSGTVILETVGALALYVLENSLACRVYIKARYSHIIIDEYQDSGEEQHEIFLKLQQLGLCAIAVGDLNQSIYGFTDKYPMYLSMLINDSNFKPFYLSVNHRSHQSIIDYSMRLLYRTYEPEYDSDIRIFFKRVEGSEKDIGQWLNVAIPFYLERYRIHKANEVGVLVRSNRTAQLITEQLELPNKVFKSTLLDEDSCLWGGVFRKVLTLVLDCRKTKYSFLEEYVDLSKNPTKARRLHELLVNLCAVSARDSSSLISYISDFILIAKTIYPKADNDAAVKALESILGSQEQLCAFKPAEEEQVQIMTLHKSKGLEFEIVFHLDLYKWILPAKKIDDNRTEAFVDYVQDLNLHYVGITRGKQCCILCTSSRRHNYMLKLKTGVPSEFLSINNLSDFRLQSEI